MIKDYHIHPQIIKRTENFDAFARVAIENGIDEVCITDHMPLVGSSSDDRIPPGKVEEYCCKVREIADKYSGKLSVKLGIEIDYHPTIRNQIENVLKAGDFDFILGSSHLHAIPELYIFNQVKTRNGYANAMLENTISAVESGYFNAIAHIDMYHWIFSNPERFPLSDDGFCEDKHSELTDKVLNAIKSNDMYLEINPHFAVSQKNISCVYPNKSIVELALDKGIKFSYGSDAHTAEDVGIMLDDLRSHSVYGKALKGWEVNENHK